LAVVGLWPTTVACADVACRDAHDRCRATALVRLPPAADLRPLGVVRDRELAELASPAAGRPQRRRRGGPDQPAAARPAALRPRGSRGAHAGQAVTILGSGLRSSAWRRSATRSS